MTNDLEKQFFDTFGIEPNCKFVKYCDDCTKCGCYHYPRITDRILLELICIYLDYRVLTTQMSVKHLKQTVLEGLIELHKQYNLKIGYYEEVQALFEE